MKVSLGSSFEFELFQLEELRNVEQLANETDGAIYSWKTVSYTNWLEKGISIADTLGLTVLARDFPDWIDLPIDREE